MLNDIEAVQYSGMPQYPLFILHLQAHFKNFSDPLVGLRVYSSFNIFFRFSGWFLESQ